MDASRRLSPPACPRARWLRCLLPLALLLCAACSALLLARLSSPLRLRRLPQGAPPRALPLPQHAIAGASVLIVSHELSLTGAPRVCAEAAALLAGLGARVTLGVLARYPPETMASTVRALLAGHPAPLPFALALEGVGADGSHAGLLALAAAAEVVVLSTAIPSMLALAQELAEARAGRPRLVAWWIHEGASVMGVFPPAATQQALGALADGEACDLVVYPSRHAQAWWQEGAAAAAAGAPPWLLPSVPSLALHWGIPSWRRAALEAAAAAEGARLALRAELGFPSAAIVFLVLASFHPLKGHAGIVRAFKLAQAQCGEGGAGALPGAPPLRLLALGASKGAPGHFPPAELAWVDGDSAMVFLGPTEAVPAHLAAADVYVTNTKLGGETWGLANLEAMAAGRPVLSSSAGAAREQLEHGVTALIHTVSEGAVDESEAAELARNMCALATNLELRSALGRAGAQLVAQQYNDPAMEQGLARALFTAADVF